MIEKSALIRRERIAGTSLKHTRAIAKVYPHMLVIIYKQFSILGHAQAEKADYYFVMPSIGAKIKLNSYLARHHIDGMYGTDAKEEIHPIAYSLNQRDEPSVYERYFFPCTPETMRLIFDVVFRSYRWRDDDVENGAEFLEGEEREIIPSNWCPYLHIPTDTTFTSFYSRKKLYGAHSLAIKLGADMRRAPERMQSILTDVGTRYATYPTEIRENCFWCEQLNVYVDKKAIAFDQHTTHDNCLGKCISKKAAKGMKLVQCERCEKRATQKTKESKVKGRHLCNDCLYELQGWEETGVDYTPVRTSKDLNARTYGIELEINDIQARGEMQRDIASMNIEGVKFGIWEDGSVYEGYEIVSNPAERRTLTRAMKVLCDKINEFPHSYNRSGLHVHVQDRRADGEKVFRAWLMLERFAYSFLPKERWGADYVGTYGRHSYETIMERTTDMEDAFDFQCNFDEKYQSINLCPLYHDSRHGTIEVRAMHATTDYRAIAHWLRFLEGIWKFSMRAKDSDWKRLYDLSGKKFTNSKKICKMLKLPKATRQFIREKQKLYDMDYEQRIPLMNKHELIWYGITPKEIESNRITMEDRLILQREAQNMSNENSRDVNDDIQETPVPRRGSVRIIEAWDVAQSDDTLIYNGNPF